MKIIADTGPLIGLAKIDQLDILNRISKQVLIPPMVYRELLGKISEESERIEKALDEFIHIDEIKIVEATIKKNLVPKIKKMLFELGEGERQAIILALKYSKDALLMMDDRAGRKVAEKLNIPHVGLIGFLLLAKKRGFLEFIVPLIDELKECGYWISDEIADISRRLAGE